MLDATEIPLIGFDRLRELGYQVGGEIRLPYTGLELDLGDNAYRDEGVFEDAQALLERVTLSLQELGDTDGVIVDGMRDKKFTGGGYCLEVQFANGSKRPFAISKAVSSCNSDVDFDYTNLHEEAHVAAYLGGLDRIEKWFREMGVGVDLDELASREKSPRETEWLASAVGLVGVKERGHCPRRVNDHCWGEVYCRHKELFKILGY